LQKISYNLGIATFSRLIIGALSLVVVGILTRYLGPTGYGQYSAIFAYLYVFTAIADLGLYTIMVREISRISDHTQERSVASKIFTLRLVTILVLICLADLLVFAFPYPLKVKLGILIASLFSVGSSLTQILMGIFQKYLRLYLVSISDVVARLVQLAALVVLIRFETGLLWFVAIVVFSEVVHFTMVYYFSRPLIKIKPVLDSSYFLQTLKTALPIAVSLIFVLIYFKLDTVLLSIMKPAQDVGIYSVAYKVLEAVIFLPAIYIGLVMPILSKHAFTKRAEFIKTFRKAFDVLSIFVWHFAGYLFLMSYWVVKIIGGGNFLNSGPVLKILSLAIFLIFFGNLGGNAIVALNLQKKALWIYLVGAVVNLSLNLILIPRYSYFAAAWTTVLTELIISVWMFYLIKNETGASATKKVFLKSAFAMLIAAGIMYPFLNNFILASFASLSYYVILFAIGGFSINDIREIVSLKKSPGLPGEIEI
jgi:O-antigen/teichoic acid export membrane protein